GNNHKGHLSSWAAYPPGGPSATVGAIVAIDYGNNAQGLRTTTKQMGTFADYPKLSRELAQSYSLSGTRQTTHYRDFVAGGNEPMWTVALDARGLPASITLDGGGVGHQTLAVQTRNVSGLVTKRHTDVAKSPMTFIESTWSYDPLGRVASQVVQQGP